MCLVGTDLVPWPCFSLSPAATQLSRGTIHFSHTLLEWWFCLGTGLKMIKPADQELNSWELWATINFSSLSFLSGFLFQWWRPRQYQWGQWGWSEERFWLKDWHGDFVPVCFCILIVSLKGNLLAQVSYLGNCLLWRLSSRGTGSPFSF